MAYNCPDTDATFYDAEQFRVHCRAVAENRIGVAMSAENAEILLQGEPGNAAEWLESAGVPDVRKALTGVEGVPLTFVAGVLLRLEEAGKNRTGVKGLLEDILAPDEVVEDDEPLDDKDNFGPAGTEAE